MTTRITFSELHSFIDGDTSDQAPLAALTCSADHIHGLLRIEISGRVLPHMGFWGPTDVCFGTWIEVLSQIAKELGTDEDATYTFDESEQGQPAFVFKRCGADLFLSVADSLLSGGAGDPSFQDVCCPWSDFQAAIEKFFFCFRAVLTEQCPQVGPAWWSAVCRSPSKSNAG